MAEGKSKKKGRNSKHGLAYKAAGRREINKAKRLYRLIKRSPLDTYIIALNSISSVHREKARKELRAAGSKLTVTESFRSNAPDLAYKMGQLGFEEA